MPKMTAKYKAALAIVVKAKIKAAGIDMANQEALYDLLQQHGWFWDSKAGWWEHHDATEADAPTELIHIRVWADLATVASAADTVVQNIVGCKLIERSKIYPCRPPKQLEGRIYLKFMPKGAKS